MVEILREESDKMVVETKDLTLANLVGEYLWNVKGVRFAGFVREHPYLKNPKIVVSASDPRKALETAGKRIAEDAEDLRKQLKK